MGKNSFVIERRNRRYQAEVLSVMHRNNDAGRTIIRFKSEPWIPPFARRELIKAILSQLLNWTSVRLQICPDGYETQIISKNDYHISLKEI